MSDDEIEYSLDVIREAMARAFNAGHRRDAKRFGFVFHALLRERAARLINDGITGSSRVLPSQGSPSPISMTGASNGKG